MARAYGITGDSDVNGYRAPMPHKPSVPHELRDPGITDSQCWGTLVLSALVGSFVACAFSDPYAGLVACWLVMVASVLALWVHRRRRLVAAYHEQRRRAR